MGQEFSSDHRDSSRQHPAQRHLVNAVIGSQPGCLLLRSSPPMLRRMEMALTDDSKMSALTVAIGG